MFLAWKCNCIGIGEAQSLRASVTPSPSNNERNLKWPIVPCHVSSRNKSDSRFLVLVSFPETDVWFCNRETFSLFFLFCFTCTCVSACWNLKRSFVFFPLMLWPMCHWRKFQKLRQSWRAPSLLLFGYYTSQIISLIVLVIWPFICLPISLRIQAPQWCGSGSHNSPTWVLIGWLYLRNIKLKSMLW